MTNSGPVAVAVWRVARKPAYATDSGNPDTRLLHGIIPGTISYYYYSLRITVGYLSFWATVAGFSR